MKKMFSRALVFLLVALLVAGMVSCGKSSQPESSKPSGQANQGQNPIVIGLVTSLTGGQAGTGKNQINGIQMAIDEWNQKGGIKGRPIKLEIEDDTSSPQGAVNAFNKLVAEKKPVAVIGPNYGNFIMAMDPYIRQAGLPFVTGASTVTITEVGNPWYIRVRSNDIVVGKLAAEFVVNELKLKKVGIIHVTGEFGQAGAKVVKDSLEALGVKPVGIEAYNAGDKDVSAQLLKLSNAGAEIVIGWGYPPDAGLVMTQLRQLGLKMKLLGSPAYGMPEALNLAKDAANGDYLLLDFMPTDAASKEWAKKIEERTKIPANFINSVYYDGVNLLLKAIENVGTDPKAIRDYILGLKDYQGITGKFSFDAKGNGLWQVYFAEVKNQKPELIKVIEAKH